MIIKIDFIIFLFFANNPNANPTDIPINPLINILNDNIADDPRDINANAIVDITAHVPPAENATLDANVNAKNDKKIIQDVKIRCDCGKMIAKDGLSKHKKTKKHLEELKKLTENAN